MAGAVGVGAEVQLLTGEANTCDIYVVTEVKAANMAATIRANNCAAATVASGLFEAPVLARQDTGSEQVAGGQFWMLSEHGGEKIWRMMRELQEMCQQCGRGVRVD